MSLMNHEIERPDLRCLLRKSKASSCRRFDRNVDFQDRFQIDKYFSRFDATGRLYVGLVGCLVDPRLP